MKKYLLLFVLSLALSGCFVCRNAKTPIAEEDYTTNKELSAGPKAEKVVVEKIVEKIVKVKEKASPTVTVSAGHFPLFDVGKDTLTEDGKAEFDKVAEELKKSPDAMIIIIGHTDNTGDDAFNVVLSELRAKSVARELQANGVNNVIGFDGKGSSEPIATNDTEEGRKENRRVEIFVRN